MVNLLTKSHQRFYHLASGKLPDCAVTFKKQCIRILLKTFWENGFEFQFGFSTSS